MIFFEGVLKGDLNKVKTLTQKRENIELMARNYYGFTPLLLAIENDKDEIAKYLIIKDGSLLKVRKGKGSGL